LSRKQRVALNSGRERGGFKIFRIRKTRKPQYSWTVMGIPTYSFIERNEYAGCSDVVMADSYLVEMFYSSINIQHYAQ